MEDKVSVDIGKYDISSEEDKKSIQIVLDMIKNGEVLNWAQLEMRGVLYGVEINEKIFINLLKYIPISYVYHFLLNSLEGDDCVRFMKCYETIEKILLLEGELVSEIQNGYGLFPKQFKFSCVDFLGSFELRHPKIFINYYMKTEPNVYAGRNKTGYNNLLRMIIRRNKIRASEVEEYKEFIPRLEELYSNHGYVEMFLN